MGDRANLVIKRNGTWRLFYDHWCAVRLDTELFWGPELAARFIEQLSPTGGWLDEVWCEGAAVLDEDARVLTWFGGDDILGDVPLRRAFLHLMRRQWDGWQIRWATGGVVEVGACVGVPAEQFVLEDRFPDDPFTTTSIPSLNRTLLTLQKDGRTHAAQVTGGWETLLLGPAQVPDLVELARAPSIVWEGGMPTGGVHVDIDAGELAYWWARPCAVEARVRSAWTAWRTRDLGDDFTAHLARAAGACQLEVPKAEELRETLLARLGVALTHESRNPAAEIAAALGSSVVSIRTAYARGSVGSEDEKRAIVARLMEQE